MPYEQSLGDNQAMQYDILSCTTNFRNIVSKGCQRAERRDQ